MSTNPSRLYAVSHASVDSFRIPSMCRNPKKINARYIAMSTMAFCASPRLFRFPHYTMLCPVSHPDSGCPAAPLRLDYSSRSV